MKTTIKDATYRWVSSFNAIPQGLMLDAIEGRCNFYEVTQRDEDDEYYDMYPMWGWFWSFGDSADDYWLEECGGLKIMSDLGFRIYEHDEYGYFFGIDGAGYDFYDYRWIQLYKARGLQWHDKEEEEYDEIL